MFRPSRKQLSSRKGAKSAEAFFAALASLARDVFPEQSGTREQTKPISRHEATDTYQRSFAQRRRVTQRFVAIVAALREMPFPVSPGRTRKQSQFRATTQRSQRLFLAALARNAFARVVQSPRARLKQISRRGAEVSWRRCARCPSRTVARANKANFAPRRNDRNGFPGELGARRLISTPLPSLAR